MNKNSKKMIAEELVSYLAIRGINYKDARSVLGQAIGIVKSIEERASLYSLLSKDRSYLHEEVRDGN